MGLFSAIAGIIGGNKAAKATTKAAELQAASTDKGIAESARQFNITRADFAPYQALGVSGVEKYGALAGLNGDEAQQAAISSVRASPFFKSLYQAGENAILANASATGGLRGGNTQASLYRMSEDTLANAIEREIGMAGGAIGVGQGAAGSVGQFGAAATNNQAILRNQGADALGQAALIRGGIAAQNWANIGKTIEDGIGGAVGGGGFNWAKAF